MYGQQYDSFDDTFKKEGCAVMSLLYSLYYMGQLGYGMTPDLVANAVKEAQKVGIISPDMVVNNWHNALNFFSNGRVRFGGYNHVSELSAGHFPDVYRFGLVAEWVSAGADDARHFTSNHPIHPSIVLYDPWPLSMAVRDGSLLSYRVLLLDS